MKNNTKIISLILSFVMIIIVFNIVPFTAMAANSNNTASGATPDEANSDYNYSVLDDGTAEITWYDGDRTEIVIPSSIDGYTVTSIGGFAFGGNTNLTSVVIPDSVTSIGNAVFRDCSNLAIIIIPDSVTSISGNAFANTAWYDNQPDGLVYAGKIAYKVKGDCPAEIKIKDGTLGISQGLFSGSPNLMRVTIPDSVITIDDMVFSGCSSLTDISVNGDNQSYTSIDGVLYNKESSTLICFPAAKAADLYIIPDSVKKINEWSFFACTSLKSVIVGSGMTSISDAAFYHCYSLQNVTIPKSVTYIGNYAFNSCKALTSISIPDSVQSIGNYAFWNCESLTNIDFGNGVKCIRYDAFDNTAWYNSQPDGLIYAGKVAYRYKGDCPSTVVIKDGTQGIASGAFNGCTSLENITIPDSVTSIGVAFANTHWFENQPDGLVYAGKVAYQYKGECPSDVAVKDGTRGISDYAFQDCASLTNITIPDSVTHIGTYSFARCTSLTNVDIPGSMISIGEFAFRGCDLLTSVTIPDSVTVIENHAFGYVMSDKRLDGFLVYGNPGSAAEAYANENGLTFVVTGQEAPKPTLSFTPKYPYEYVENHNGYWESNDPDGSKCFVYNSPLSFDVGDKLSITYTDDKGTVDYYYQGRRFEDEEGNIINSNDVKCSDGHGWTVGGENIFTITYDNMSTEVPVTLVKPEDASLRFIPAKPYELIENHDGYMSNDHFRYYTPSLVKGDQIIVDYGDKTVAYTRQSGKGFFDENGQPLPNYGVRDDQDQNPWTLGTDNYFIVTAVGKTAIVPVSIIEYPVESIEFQLASPVILYENQDGYYINEEGISLRADENGYYYIEYDSSDELVKVYTEPAGFRYNQIPVYKDGNKLIIHNKDGSTKTLTQKYVFTEEDNGYFFVDENGNYDNNVKFNWEDQESTPFKLGDDNRITVQYLDNTTTVPVTVVQNNIESIEFQPIKPIVYNLNDPKDVYIENEYENYRVIYNTQKLHETGSILTAHFKDGTTKKYSFYSVPTIYDGKYNPVLAPRYYAVDEDGSVIGYSSLTFDCDTEDWTAGNTYEMNVSYLGVSTQVPVTITGEGSDLDYTLGDVNADGKIDITDATETQKYVAELTEFTPEQEAAADTNGDGKVDITDATEIQKFVAELIDHFGK